MKFILSFILFGCFLQGAVMQEGEFYKEKQELQELKQELSDFYDKKEKQYLAHKKELDDLLQKIETRKKQIEQIKKDTLEIENEITRKVVSRTTKMYDKMKVKVVLDIFNKMIQEGKINEVFDIILRLKQKRVLVILKKLDVNTKTTIMEKMKHYKYKQKMNKGK